MGGLDETSHELFWWCRQRTQRPVSILYRAVWRDGTTNTKTWTSFFIPILPWVRPKRSKGHWKMVPCPYPGALWESTARPSVQVFFVSFPKPGYIHGFVRTGVTVLFFLWRKQRRRVGMNFVSAQKTAKALHFRNSDSVCSFLKNRNAPVTVEKILFFQKRKTQRG